MGQGTRRINQDPADLYGNGGRLDHRYENLAGNKFIENFISERNDSIITKEKMAEQNVTIVKQMELKRCSYLMFDDQELSLRWKVEEDFGATKSTSKVSGTRERRRVTFIPSAAATGSSNFTNNISLALLINATGSTGVLGLKCCIL